MFMKTILFLLAATLTLAACSSNDAKPSAARPAGKDSASATTIQWLDSTDQDLGTVIEGAKVTVIWRFKNTGNKPLVIENVHASCGCTVAEKPEGAVPPGGEDRIRAVFNSEGRQGLQMKEVTVMANTSPRPDQILNFKVNVTAQ